MPSKYYNPTLASRVAAAKSSGFLDAGKVLGESYAAAQAQSSPYVMGALKEYQDDINKIYDINFDENGIALDQLGDLKEFVKEQKNKAFEARQKGIFTGKEALGDAILSVKGAANLAKTHGAITQEIQGFLQDPDRVSTANDYAMLAPLSLIANSKIDYNDPDGNFFVLADGETKMSLKQVQNTLNNLIEVPDEAYLNLYDKSQNFVKEYMDETGKKYYGYNSLDDAKMRTLVFDTIDEYGKDFVYDAMSNKNAYRGVTVGAFIDNNLAKEISDKYGYNNFNPATPLDLQSKTKSQIDSIISQKFGVSDPDDIFRIHKELVSTAYTQALKTQYPMGGPQFKPKPKTGSGAPTTEPYVKDVANRIKNILQKEGGTMNESTFVEIANQTLSKESKREGKIFTDRNDGKSIYIENALKKQKELDLKEQDKKSKKDFADEFERLYPAGAGNIFLNGNPVIIDLSDQRAIGEEILQQSGVSDYEKFIRNYLGELKAPKMRTETFGSPVVGTTPVPAKQQLP